MIGSYAGAHVGRDAASRAIRLFGVFATVALLIAMLAILTSSERALAQTPDPDDGTIRVDVTDGTIPTPTPSTISSGSNQSPTRPPVVGSGGSGGGAGGSSTPNTTGTVTQAIILDPAAADDALDDATVVAGILAMSGLSANASPSIGVGNGHLTVDFVIRNMSSTAFDSTAKFWVDNMFGGRIAEIDDVRVTDLKPDETRRVQVRFEGLGQHILLHVNGKLTPPATLAGEKLEPISRNVSVLVPPWFSIALIGALVALSWLGWRLYTRRAAVVGLQPVPA